MGNVLDQAWIVDQSRDRWAGQYAQDDVGEQQLLAGIKGQGRYDGRTGKDEKDRKENRFAHTRFAMV